MFLHGRNHGCAVVSHMYSCVRDHSLHSCSDRRADRTCCSLSKCCAAITSLVQASSNEV